MFLGFGAFETTAFCTAILVAGYSLISNPKGRQTGLDQSEYKVYAGWRLAMFVLVAQTALLIAVVSVLARDGTASTKAMVWVFLSMLAPWSPLAGRVRQTLSSAPRVQRMMRSRLTRNEIAALMRDRFKFGQRGIALPVIIFHAEGELPDHPLAALLANSQLAPHADQIREYASIAAQSQDKQALELGSLWAMNQSLQPSQIPRHKYIAWRFVSSIDFLAQWWTSRSIPLHADPMPGIKSMYIRARVLDIADMLQQGGTISDALVNRGMHKLFCKRCRLTTRGAVEAFLESSERGHTDLRAKLWLRDIGMNWQGAFERVIDVMWEASFMEARGMKVEMDEEDNSPSYGDRTKVSTTKTLALIWLIIRSIVHENGEGVSYEKISQIVRAGSFSRLWWDRYWQHLADSLVDSDSGLQDAIPEERINAKMPSHFKATLRTLIDQDMDEIVTTLLRFPLKESLCGSESCILSKGKITLSKY